MIVDLSNYNGKVIVTVLDANSRLIILNNSRLQL